MRHLKLLVPLIAIMLTGLLLTPPSAKASPEDDGCPNTNGQYYNSHLIPFFNTNLRQLALVDSSSFPYRVVQIITDGVDVMAPLDGHTTWSPSCRYFAFTIGASGSTDTILWDTVSQQRVGTYHRSDQYDPPGSTGTAAIII